jgi:hypothetical protein
MARIFFDLDDEHTAMLDAIQAEAGVGTRSGLAKDLLIAVLEDDAEAHGMSPQDPRTKVIVLQNWRGGRRV